MGALAAFAFGMLTGLTIYWVFYRVFWRRWQENQEHDMAYLQEKVKSAEFTNISLERQLAAQKGDLAGMQTKIADLERENRQALARLVDANAEKQSLVMHLETLRSELIAYKKVVSEPNLPALPSPTDLAPHSNGNTHDKVLKGIPPQKINDTTPANGAGNSTKVVPKLLPPPERASRFLPAEQILEPVLIIARPRMAGDRLEIIQGIGPAIAKKLHQAGIDSFLALSLLTAERLKELVGSRTAKLLDAESVICQAKKLAGERHAR